MKTTYEDNVLTMTLTGRLTAEVSDATMEDLRKESLAHPEVREIYLDLRDLSYISSAGLRVLLTLQNETKIKLHVENVNDEVMDIFQTTGFTELMHVRKPFRNVSLDHAHLIGRGRVGAVYRLDAERVIKVCFDRSGSTLARIDRDRDISQALFLKGIPTAIPFDVVITPEGYGVIYELLEGENILQYIYSHPHMVDRVALKIGRLLRKLHTTDASELRLPDSDDILKKQLGVLAMMLPEDKKGRVEEFMGRIPKRTTLVHGDLNMGNIMIIDKGGEEEPEPLLIDIADVMTGHPVFDFQTIYQSAASADQAFLGTPVEEMIAQMAYRMEQSAPELFGGALKGESGSLVSCSGTYWRNLIRGYFDITEEKDLEEADAILCEAGRSTFLRPSKKEGKAGEVMDLILRVFTDHMDELDRLFDLNW